MDALNRRPGGASHCHDLRRSPSPSSRPPGVDVSLRDRLDRDECALGGVRIADVIGLAEPLESAHAVQFISAEYPYQDYLTLEQSALPDAMLADEMDGRPLTRPHGAPLRLVVPEMYGYKGVKWINEIKLTSRAELGYWEFEGYDQDAWIRGYPHRA